MNDARAIALKLGAIAVTLLGILPPARFTRLLRERRERLALGLFHLLARLPSGFHSLDADLSDRNFSRNACSARFASSLTASKSKIATRVAVNVSQTQTTQNRITNHGCSCGFNTGARNVKPEIKSSTATPSSNAIALRRVR